MKCKICGNDMILGDLGWYCDKDEEHYENVMPLTEEQKDKLIEHRFKQVSDMRRQISDLQSQLAEKDKEIKQLKHVKVTIGTMENNQVDISSTTYIDQDKISFAIEKFQETKKSLRDKVCLMENDEHCYLQNAIHWQDVVAIIDNQIASLKKGVE